MAREVHERVIGGEHIYKVTLLGAKAGRVMSVRLVKLLGPMASSFVEGVAGAKGDGDVSLAVGASEALRELVQRLSIEDLGAIQDELAKNTTVVLDAEREPRLSDIFDDHFAGHYDAMMLWTKFALEVNFASFFGGSLASGGLLGRLKTLLESASQSRKASTGTSTASPPVDTTAQA